MSSKPSQRINTAYACYQESLVNPELKGKILQCMPQKLYDLWAVVSPEEIFDNYGFLSLDFRVSLIIFLYFASPAEGPRAACPRVLDTGRTFKLRGGSE